MKDEQTDRQTEPKRCSNNGMNDKNISFPLPGFIDCTQNNISPNGTIPGAVSH